MNKLIFIFFLSAYAFCGFSTDIETDPVKFFVNLKNKYPIMPQKDSTEEEDFQNELTKIAGLFDLTKEVDNKIIDLLDKMTIQEIEAFNESMYETFYSKSTTGRRKTHHAYIEVIEQYCKKRLSSFLENFAGFETFDFSDPQINELASLINMSPKDKNSLLSKKNINSILKAIVNLSYEDFSKNLYISSLLREVSKKIKKYGYISKNNSPDEIVLVEQARFKLSYLIGEKNTFQNIVKSDISKKFEFFYKQSDPFDVIYNNDGYSTTEHKAFIKGNAVKDVNNPIGYVIFIPKTEIKNIVVDIYGGWQKTDINTRLSNPRNYLDNFEKSILNNETVLIKLNLPDLLKNDVIQKGLRESLLKEIHDAVDHFYNILKNNPKNIHKSLDKLKDKPIFLMGSSFGGMMSVYHAINYPGTFTGYISHAGALFGQAGYDSKYCGNYLKVADTDKIKLIQDPIFIHHSLDDNRVNVKASLEFYRLAKLVKKEYLIKLFIDDHGSSVDEKEPDLHGHFFPENYYLKVFLEQLIDFINSNGNNIEPILNEWRYEKYSEIAHRFDGLGSHEHKDQKRDLHKVLLSKGVIYYNDLRKSGNKDDFEQLWSTNILPNLWKTALKESLRPKSSYSNKNNTLAAFNIHKEFKKLLECSDAELKNMVKIILENNIYNRYVDEKLIITDNFINNVLQDIKDWLNDEREYQEYSIFNNTNHAFISIIIDNVFDMLLKKQTPSAIEIFNNTKLKEDLLNTIKKQRQKALKIIYDKITKDPKR
jgi:hypothetical protein